MTISSATNIPVNRSLKGNLVFPAKVTCGNEVWDFFFPSGIIFPQSALCLMGGNADSDTFLPLLVNGCKFVNAEAYPDFLFYFFSNLLVILLKILEAIDWAF